MPRRQPESISVEESHRLGQLSLLEFVPALSTDLKEPKHLADLAYMLSRTETEAVRGLSSVATRHGKTTLIGHHVARSLVRNPKREFVYFTFDHDFATKKSREIRELTMAAGVRLSEDFNTIREWRTKDGGGLFACSVGQHIVGRGFHEAIIDDPYGSFEEVEDAERRENVERAINFIRTRIHPGGSMIINMSRFDFEDSIGVRADQGWDLVSAPAIDDRGLPTWPERWSVEELERMRRELKADDPRERTWWAQWMCDPQPRARGKFQQFTRYEQIPPWSFRIGYGIDLAFTQGVRSDFFAMVALKVCGRNVYVLDVVRDKLDATMIEAAARSMVSRHGRGPIFTYASGPERGTIKLMRQRGLEFVPMQARYNKSVRAEPTIQRSNDGQILWPASAPWIDPVERRFRAFTGNEKASGDDEIDALVSGCDGMLGAAVAGAVKTVGHAYAGFSAVDAKSQHQPHSFMHWDKPLR